MALIKQASSKALIRDAIVLNLSDIQRQARELEERANRKAEQIIRDAEAERRRLLEGAEAEGRAEGVRLGRAEGHEQGLEAGRAKAVRQSKEKIRIAIEAWSEALDRFEQARDGLMVDARSDVINLALAIAQKVIRRTLQNDPDCVRRQMHDALALTLRSTRLTIAVHPEDMAAAEESLPDLVRRFERCSHAELVEDESLSKGSCVVRTDRGVINADIEVQIERIVAELAPTPGSANPQAEQPSEPAESPDEQNDDEVGSQ
ncbi:MAG: hypothetical protein EA376_10310 [Phycisphaeraceae bacterium]|nr:MAG: hypothetical protein EA376_10310 [Phycisphaeraceae bacterium]